MKQFDFEKVHWKYRFSHGGSLRRLRAGRGTRPLSSREPLHLVFKARRASVRSGLRTYQRFFLIQTLVQKYAVKFFVKVEQISVQGDHIHLLIRTSRRSNFHSFFRVVAGQIAQRFEKEGLMTVPAREAEVTDTPASDRTAGKIRHAKSRSAANVTDTPAANPRLSKKPKLWLHRPFTRVIRGYKPYQTVRDYIQLNEQEALGNIPYQKRRLKDLKPEWWTKLWDA